MGQTVEKIVDVPVVKQVDVPHVTTVEKIVEVPHTQVIEEIMEVPMVGQTLQGNQHHTEQQLPSIREQAHPEVHETHEHGGSLPAEHGGVVHKEYQQPVMQYAAPQTVHTVAAPVTYAAPAQISSVGSVPVHQPVTYAAPATTMQMAVPTT